MHAVVCSAAHCSVGMRLTGGACRAHLQGAVLRLAWLPVCLRPCSQQYHRYLRRGTPQLPSHLSTLPFGSLLPRSAVVQWVHDITWGAWLALCLAAGLAVWSLANYFKQVRVRLCCRGCVYAAFRHGMHETC